MKRPCQAMQAIRPSRGVSFSARCRSLAAGLGAASCGYALAGRGSFLPDYIRVLGIPMFGNATPFQTVEQVFTQKVRLEFQSSRRYTVVPTDEGVDGIVRGQIISISTQPVQPDRCAAGVAISRHGGGEDRLRGRQGAEDVVGEPVAVVFRRIRAGQPRDVRRRCLGVHRQRARGDGPHVHGLRAIGCECHSRGFLDRPSQANRPTARKVQCPHLLRFGNRSKPARRHPLRARGRRPAVAPRPGARVCESRRGRSAGLQRRKLLRQRSDQRGRARPADRIAALDGANAADDVADARGDRPRGRAAAGAETREGRGGRAGRRGCRRKASAAPRRPRSSRPTSRSRSR